MKFTPIADYGMIGNQGSCALVSKEGSIDWCCLPRIDSPSVFAGILDPEKGGVFSIHPTDDVKAYEQEYLNDTNILITRFRTEGGMLEIHDWMHMGAFSTDEQEYHRLPAVYRSLRCLEGEVNVRVFFDPRLDYARAETRIETAEKSLLIASSDDALHLHSDLIFSLASPHGAESVFTLTQGEERSLVLTYGRTTWPDLTPSAKSYRETKEYWNTWVKNARQETAEALGEWYETVTRSSLVLKILAGGQGIAAAATTSLPETPGGSDNWDYRFNWIRDTSFTLQALTKLGHYTDAHEFLTWLVDLLHTGGRRPVDLQVLYPLHSTLLSPEEELSHLTGYMHSRPVRIGNAASLQRQSDIYGEIMETVYRYETLRPGIDEKVGHVLTDIVNYVCEIWREPDHGIWELRTDPAHYLYSKVMCWVAIDRGIKLAERHEWHIDYDFWKKERDAIRAMVMDLGYNEKRQSFVQSFGSDIIDATALLFPLLEFIEPDHPYAISTLHAIQEHLAVGPHVYRSEAHNGREGTFAFCSFWLVDALVLAGRLEEAKKNFRVLCDSANHLGLYAEEIEPHSGMFLGNFPQAFTHVGLINSALYLARAQGDSEATGELIGESQMPDEQN